MSQVEIFWINEIRIKNRHLYFTYSAPPSCLAPWCLLYSLDHPDQGNRDPREFLLTPPLQLELLPGLLVMLLHLLQDFHLQLQASCFLVLWINSMNKCISSILSEIMEVRIKWIGTCIHHKYFIINHSQLFVHTPYRYEAKWSMHLPPKLSSKGLLLLSGLVGWIFAAIWKTEEKSHNLVSSFFQRHLGNIF